jgi:serine/threonine-protein kinase
MQIPVSLRELFEQVLLLPLADRAAFIAAQCPDAATRARLQRMCEADASDVDTLAASGADTVAGVLGDIDFAQALPCGSRIGPFELIEVLGEGGSSTVFRAVREMQGVRQEVALKLLRRGLYSPDAQRQFRRERLALSQLQHAGIARLIEGGVTDSGLAYIALDLVEGAPITDHVRVRRLDLRQRVELLRQVCRAVEAAHRALIVHRDLKPSNVLVSGDGQIKLLDFGIAKLLDAEDDTQTRLPAFTPAYAAPEQRDGGLITTATDVYALGVLLGELVTGERLNDGSGRTPSGQVSAHAEAGVLPAPPHTTRRQLRGDLDNIVLKAIAGEPERRYASAGAFADDLERWLDGRPVAAHPPSSWYRTRKFIVRHKGSVATTVAFVLAILAALGLALWQAGVARREAQRARAVRDFLVQVFDAAKADLPSNERPTPEALLREAARRARADASIDPALRADFLFTLGEVAFSLGDYAQAAPLMDETLRRLDEAGVGADASERVYPTVNKAALLDRTDHDSEAASLLAGILPLLRRDDSEAAVSGLQVYALTQVGAGHEDDAMSYAKEAAAKAERVWPANSDHVAKAAAFPGGLLIYMHRYSEGAVLLEPVIARWRALGLPLDIEFAQALNNLAVAKKHNGDRAGAEALFREGVALRRRIYEGRPHDRLAIPLESLGIFLTEDERFDEAQTLLNEALGIYRATLGADSARVASALESLGDLEYHRRHFDVAEKDLRESVAIYTAHVKDTGQDDDLALARSHLAATLVELGRSDEAAALVATALAALRARHGDEHEYVATAMIVQARIALARGDARTALEDSVRTRDLLSRLSSPNARLGADNEALAAHALSALDRSDDAIAAVAQALAAQRSANANAHSKIAALLALRARLLTASRQDADAEAARAQARALQVPANLLAPEDARTIEPDALR